MDSGPQRGVEPGGVKKLAAARDARWLAGRERREQECRLAAGKLADPD